MLVRWPVRHDGRTSLSSGVESLMIKGRIRRLLVLAAAMTGLLALFETAAHAGTNLNHCEPLRRV